ncbi:sugar phosphate isomerase/epimerase family protein [Tundrisphaera sp. TA3]|uniref:sugar phosphate isomerase/epimerase family protein n=1 Tax=Tundrisphaera sp. TA3 TaxID=3435775 RepID=UPI003EBC624E
MQHTDLRNVNRRDFLATGLAAAGALALGGRSAFAHDHGFGPFKVGLQSYSLREYNAQDALAKTKDLGVHYWESYSKHTPIDVSKAAAAKEMAAGSEVKVIGFGVSAFTKDHDANRKIFEFGKALGVDYLSADPTPDAFDSLDKLVEEYDIAIGIHNHGPGHRWAKIDTIAAAIKDHHKLVGVCVDAGHFLRSSEDPVRAVEVFGKRTYGVHLKDVKDAKTFTILGEGDLRVAALLQALAKNDYQYCLAVEYEENPKDPIADIHKCLDAVRAAVKSLKTA